MTAMALFDADWAREKKGSRRKANERQSGWLKETGKVFTTL